MKKTKTIMNIYYEPYVQLKQIINSRDDIIPINCGNLKQPAKMKKMVFETDFKDNIAYLNPKLNEMTAIYLAWKNPEILEDAERVGVCHYRRFFGRSIMKKLPDEGIFVAKPVSVFEKTSNGTKFADMRRAYEICHVIEDFDKMIELARKSSFKHIVDDWLRQQCLFAPQNTFMVDRKLFNEYCEEMFPMLFTLEKSISLEGRDGYQKRALAFLAERLTSMWMMSKAPFNKTYLTDVEYHEEFKPTAAKDNRGQYE